MDIVIPQIKSKLVATFGTESLKYLTFVCIPASSAIKTQARYEEFSQRLCSETGMINAYQHMQVVASSQEKNLEVVVFLLITYPLIIVSLEENIYSF